MSSISSCQRILEEVQHAIASNFHNNIHPDKLHVTMSGKPEDRTMCTCCISVWLKRVLRETTEENNKQRQQFNALFEMFASNMFELWKEGQK